ncbi:MAG: hypothetical protein QNJ92_00715 [Alphaproteobacteria bacterium]|nr:hypothetical protein [Alphaproteobacteria bacterium]
MTLLQKLSLGFTAGALGAVANVVFVWLVVSAGIAAAAGITLPGPPPLPGFLYKQIVWGGLWGFLFVAPILSRSWWQRGLVVGLLASLVALFVFIPQTPLGTAGLNAGAMFPVLVLLANSVWGLAAAWWYARTAARPEAA